MLTSEFNQEMGGLIRSLADRVLREPALTNSFPAPNGHPADSIEHIDRAIVTLIATRLALSGKSLG